MSGWLYWHSKLLNDMPRMEAYRRAISKAVKPGDVVLDIGTGSGIMAMFACRAGARRVYAVELEDIVIAARRLSEMNGFGDRIVFLHKDARRIRLPEKADVIISELISDNGPGENMAAIVNSCRDRFLKPDGKIVPQKVDMLIAPVQDNATYRTIHLPGKGLYGIDFSSYYQLSRNVTIRSKAKRQALLAPGRTAYSYNAYTAVKPDRFDAELVFKVQKEGIFHGFSSWFSSKLAEGVELCNKPPSKLCWSTIFYPLTHPVPVAPGMTISLKFRGRYDLPMEENSADWATTVRKGRQVIAGYKQSSAAALPDY